MVESVLGFVLEKGHSAVDWSTRPLPEPWLRYAALDVELLVDLRDALEKELDRQGKLELGPQEFDAIAVGAAAGAPQGPLAPYVRHAQGAPASADGRRTGAVADPRPDRAAPGRVAGQGARDAAIVEAALAVPANVHALAALTGFGHRMGRRQLEQWQAAVDRREGAARRAAAAAGAAA